MENNLTPSLSVIAERLSKSEIFNTLSESDLLDIADFWRNGSEIATTPTDTDRDFFLPAGYGPGQAHTNFSVGGDPEFAEGAGIPMAAGYEGMGKGSAHGGTLMVYDIITQRVGDGNSGSIVRVKWRHVN